MQLSFQRAELKPANIHLPFPGKWIDTLVLNFSWFCQIFCFDFNDCCVSYLTTIFIMLQVADLFLEGTKKKMNSLVSRTPRITYTVTVIEIFFFITSLCTAWCSEIGSLWSLDAPELHASVTSENQFHCTRLYTIFRKLGVMITTY